MSLELQISELTTTLKDAIVALQENTAVGKQVLAGAGRAAENDGIPAFAKEAKAATTPDTSVTSITDAPKKRGPKPKAATPEPNVYDKICRLVEQLVDTNQTDKIISVFGKFGVKKASLLAPENYDEVYELLSKEVEEPMATASFV